MAMSLWRRRWEGPVHRTTIMLPVDLKNRAQRRAARDQISLGELIRQALEAHLQPVQSTSEPDPLFADVPLYDGPVPPDGAENHDRYLYGDDE